MPDSGPLAQAVRAELTSLAGGAPTEGNAVRVLADGADSFGAMLALVRGAKADVRFENFIFRADTVGRTFAKELRERAEAGVSVRVLHDPIGALMARRPPADLLFRGSTAQVRLFNLHLPKPRAPSLGRDHRKLVVVDGTDMLAGGICLADPWAGNCIRHCTWRDSAIQIRGPASRRAGEAFDEAWSHSAPLLKRRTSGAREPQRGLDAMATALKDERQLSGAPRGIPVRVHANFGDRRPTRRVLARAIRSAQREVLVTNPYLLPTEDVLQALCATARRGVEVSIIIPGRNNHRLVGLSSEHRLRPLLEAGCEVRFWDGAMIHAKSVVIDGIWTLIGSSNLDTLSLARNVELDVEVHGEAIGAQMTELFRADAHMSSAFSLRDWMNRSPARRLVAGLSSSLRRWQ